MLTLDKYELSKKCIAFTGDNAKVDFGDLNRKSSQNVYIYLETTPEKRKFLFISCPAHIIHNNLHHSTDLMRMDKETIILKLFNHCKTMVT